METTLSFYQPTGSINVPKLLLSLVIILVGCLVFGYLYAVLVYWIPIPYINFFITLGFGIGLRILVDFTISIGHIRSSSLAVMLALLAAILGYYFHWAAYIPAVLNDGFPGIGEFFTMVFNPLLMKDSATLLNAIGVWSIRDISNTGTFGMIIWGIEALVIMGSPLLSAIGRKVIPYSETQQRFYAEHPIPIGVSIAVPPQQFAKELLEDGVLAIQKHITPAATSPFHRFLLYYLPEESDQYLDIIQTVVTIDDEGNDVRTDKVQIDNLKISNELAHFLKEGFGWFTEEE